jgi:hypothetical protein
VTTRYNQIQPLSIHQDGGEAGALELPGRPGPEAGRGVAERGPMAREGSANGAPRVEQLKGVRRGLHGDLGGGGCGEEGGVSLQGGGDAEAQASEAQEEGELGQNRIRREVLGGRVVHQEKGGKKHLTFSSGDVGGEPLPRRCAGEVGEAGLEGGAEQKELVLRGEGKGRERSHQTLDSSGTRAGVGLDKGVRPEGGAGSNQPLRAVGDAQGGSGGSARVRRSMYYSVISGALRELSVALCRGIASLCRSGAYVATRAAGRAPMRGLAQPSAEVV